MNVEQNPKPAPELIWRDLDDGTVLVSPQAGRVRVLNQAGTIIWQLLSEGRTVSEIEAHLVNRYEVAQERAASDLQTFLSDLTERGLLIWRQ